MKKSELIELIRETIYGELPEIISEIKKDIREEMLSEGMDLGPNPATAKDGEAIREHIRQTHGIANRPAPVGAQQIVDYKGDKISSGVGVMDWFKGQVTEGATNPKKAYTDDQMTNFMSKKFGKQIK